MSPHSPFIQAAAEITIGDRTVSLSTPSSGFVHRPDLGILHRASMSAASIYLDAFVCHPRAIRTPSGEYLLFFAAGAMHYAWAGKGPGGNSMLVCRSANGGRTWSAPRPAWEVPYSQHAAILFQPDASGPLYAFGTEPRHDVFDGEENAAIGFRRSDDEGRTWSEVTLIRPANDPGFQGMSAMRMCATDSGTWLVGSHAGQWSGVEGVDRRVSTQQYILRSEDEGATWEVLPGASPHGWTAGEYDRMDEGRPISLGGDWVLLMVRTPSGFLWELRSDDAGRTWSEPAPTSLEHPDAPPMLFHLDARTLIAFHHNKRVLGSCNHEARTELWFSLSNDDGKTWSEPRFVLANTALTPPGARVYSPMVSYADLLVDGDDLHLFIDHQGRQILHVRSSRATLLGCPTRGELFPE